VLIEHALDRAWLCQTESRVVGNVAEWSWRPSGGSSSPCGSSLLPIDRQEQTARLPAGHNAGSQAVAHAAKSHPRQADETQTWQGLQAMHRGVKERPLPAPMTRTAEPQSRGSSRRTRSLLACARSRRLHRQYRRRPWTLGHDDPRRQRPVRSATTTVASGWSARPAWGTSPSQSTVLTVLTQTPPFGGVTADSKSIGDALEVRAQLTAPMSERLA
jgi:hypothetical protein